MKIISVIMLVICLICLLSVPLQAACPYDHLIIGCNRDGEPNTPDDNILYLDTQDLYRRSDPDNRDQYTWLNWYYTLYSTGSSWFIAEPGIGLFHHPDEPGTFQFEDPNRCMVGTKDIDYRIIVECVDISPDFYAAISFSPVLTQPGNSFNHSSNSDNNGHMHLQYFASHNQLNWISLRVYDEFYDPDNPDSGYQPSDSVTIVFGTSPAPGDICVDGSINLLDLEKLAAFWLRAGSSQQYSSLGQAAWDLFDRADINRDYAVDILDFESLSQNWMQ